MIPFADLMRRAHAMMSKVAHRVAALLIARHLSDDTPAPVPEPMLERSPAPVPEAMPEPVLEPVPVSMPDEPKHSPRNEEVPKMIPTLHELLHDLDLTMRATRIDYDQFSNLPPRDVANLRKGGISICPAITVHYEDALDGKLDQTIDHEMSIANPNYLPTTLCLALPFENDPHAKGFTASFLFALRMPSAPWNVRNLHKDDAVYLVGIAYRIPAADRMHRRHKKDGLWWITQFAGINPKTGAITVTEFLRRKTVFVGKHGDHYSQAVWKSGNIPIGEDAPTEAQGRNKSKAFIAVLFDTMNFYKNEWSVTVKKEARRITFHIDPHNVRHFFSKRDIEDGQSKRRAIFHIVGEHTRIGKNGKRHLVREHSRGERQFTWQGFECTVTSPRFHVVAPGDFDVAPVYADEFAGAKFCPLGETLKSVNEFIDHAPRRALDEAEALKEVSR